MSTRMGTATCALTMILALGLGAARPAVAAEVVAVTVDATPGLESARAMQLLVLQELQERGFATLDPVPLRATMSADDARRLAIEAGAVRLFALQLAPLGEAVAAGMSEIDLRNGAAMYGSSLVIDTPADADRAFDRMVDAVLEGVPVNETARVATLTEHEARPHSKRPGEFLWGFSVMTAVGLQSAHNGGPTPTWGGSLHFLYEIENALFGGRLGGAGSAEGGMSDVSVVAYWLMLDTDISPYLGGGLGFSFNRYNGADEFGGHATISAGVELFRLHSARMMIGFDVMLPFYAIDRNCYDCDRDYGSDEKVWTPTLLFNVGVLF